MLPHIVKQPLKIFLHDFILRIQTKGKEKERVDQPFRIFAKWQVFVSRLAWKLKWLTFYHGMKGVWRNLSKANSSSNTSRWQVTPSGVILFQETSQFEKLLDLMIAPDVNLSQNAGFEIFTGDWNRAHHCWICNFYDCNSFIFCISFVWSRWVVNVVLWSCVFDFLFSSVFWVHEIWAGSIFHTR